MSLKQAAQKWNVPERTVRKWCINKEIKAVKIDETWLVIQNQSTPILDIDDFKIKGLKEAVKKYNAHQNIARIYFDHYTRLVWTAFFPDESELPSYHYVSAVEIYNKVLDAELHGQVTEEQILILCYDNYLDTIYSSIDDLPF